MEFPITIAYNMAEKKIGCVLLQTLLGSTFPPGNVSALFDADEWELSPSKCKLYTIKNQQEFDLMVKITHENNKKGE